MNTYQKATNSLPSYSSALTNLQANLKSVILELDTNILKYQKDISSKAKKINGNTSHIESILDKLQRMKSESNKAIKDAESYKLEIKNKLLKEFNRVVFDLDNMKTSLSLTRDFNSLSIEIKKIDLNRIVQLNSSISENLDFVTKQIDDIYLNKRGM